MARPYWIIKVLNRKQKKRLGFIFSFYNFSLQRAFLNIDGKLLGRLYQMKQIAADSYYKFIDKYFDRIQIARMSDILKFDYELDKIFQ